MDFLGRQLHTGPQPARGCDRTGGPLFLLRTSAAKSHLNSGSRKLQMALAGLAASPCWEPCSLMARRDDVPILYYSLARPENPRSPLSEKGMTLPRKTTSSHLRMSARLASPQSYYRNLSFRARETPLFGWRAIFQESFASHVNRWIYLGDSSRPALSLPRAVTELAGLFFCCVPLRRNHT